MIVAIPEILVAFVAVSIIMAGIGALYIGHMIRKSEIEHGNIHRRFFNTDPGGWRFVMTPVFRRWYRGF
jgi:hypothetical protein